MPGKSALVTGADRMAGQHVVATLVSMDYRIVALTSQTPQRELGQVQYTRGDITDLPEWEEQLEGIDLIVHCAHLESYQRRDRKRMTQYNVLATRNLVDAALSYGVNRMVYLGSAYALARSADPLLIASDASGNPVFHSHFARTIFHAELEIWRAEAEGMQVGILHPARLIDPESGKRDLPVGALTEDKYAHTDQMGLLTTGDLGNWVRCVLDRSLWSERFLVCSDLGTPGSNTREDGAQSGESILTNGGVDSHPSKGTNGFGLLMKWLAALRDESLGNEWKKFNALNLSFRTTERERELCLNFHSTSHKDSSLAK